MGQKDSKPRSYSLSSSEIDDVARDTNAKPQDIKAVLKAFSKISTPDGKVSRADFKKVYAYGIIFLRRSQELTLRCVCGVVFFHSIEDHYGGGDSTITRMILLNFVRF